MLTESKRFINRVRRRRPLLSRRDAITTRAGDEAFASAFVRGDPAGRPYAPNPV